MTPYKSQAADKRQSTRDRRRLRALPVSEFGEECYVATGGQRIPGERGGGNGGAAGAVQRHWGQLGGAGSVSGTTGSGYHRGQIRCSRSRRITHIHTAVRVSVPGL